MNNRTPSVGTAPVPLEPWEDELLGLARGTLEAYIVSGLRPAGEPRDPRLLEPAAVFVTLRFRNRFDNEPGELRGCVGQIQAREPLHLAVQDAVIQAAVADPRFKPVRASELASLQIEISVLSPMTLVTDLTQVTIGRDGLFIDGQGHRGLLLPDVASEYGWDDQDYLRGIYLKAGLPNDAWPSHAKLYRFTAQHIGEA